MKKMKKALLLILAISVLMAVFCSACFADNGVPSEKTYTINVSSGNRGHFNNSGDKYSFTVLNGAEVNMNNALGTTSETGFSNVSVDDSRYYVKGIRPAGYDNDEQTSLLVFDATEDQEYVLVYAVKGNMVKYTVRYISNTGAVLADEIEGYANANEAFVVGCRDIDGYIPNTYNYSKTLTTNEAENVFTFIYSPVPQEQEPQTAEDQNQNAGNGNVEGDYNIEAIQQPAQLINLDEEEVPLANLDGVGNKNALAKPLIIGGSVILIGLFALMILLDSKKKREEKDV